MPQAPVKEPATKPPAKTDPANPKPFNPTKPKVQPNPKA